MTSVDRWLLPDGVDEILPPEAERLELTRRRLLDHFVGWGYDYVIPPMIEFLESLLTGTGSDLDLKTFKLTDQLSGRMLGIRADITPQVARMDAHSLPVEGVQRLCYAGTVLHTRPDHMLASRAPIKVGAELFGDTGTSGDLEIVSLMLDSLLQYSLPSLNLELGDVGIFRLLQQKAGLEPTEEQRLFDLIQQKSADLGTALLALEVPSNLSDQLVQLPTLTGDESVLQRAGQVFADFPAVLERLKNTRKLAAAIQERFPAVNIHFDLSELRGFAYHTGLVFACYDQSGLLLARGGRYDHVGEVFGRARGATGFDVDVKTLVRCESAETIESKRVKVAPRTGDALQRFQAMQQYRQQGYRVIETDDSSLADFDFELVLDDQDWLLQPLKGSEK